jgi:hypothetical protein
MEIAKVIKAGVNVVEGTPKMSGIGKKCSKVKYRQFLGEKNHFSRLSTNKYNLISD